MRVHVYELLDIINRVKTHASENLDLYFLLYS